MTKGEALVSLSLMTEWEWMQREIGYVDDGDHGSNAGVWTEAMMVVGVGCAGSGCRLVNTNTASYSYSYYYSSYSEKPESGPGPRLHHHLRIRTFPFRWPRHAGYTRRGGGWVDNRKKKGIFFTYVCIYFSRNHIDGGRS